MIKVDYTAQKKLLPDFLKFNLNKRGVSFLRECSAVTITDPWDFFLLIARADYRRWIWLCHISYSWSDVNYSHAPHFCQHVTFDTVQDDNITSGSFRMWASAWWPHSAQSWTLDNDSLLVTVIYSAAQNQTDVTSPQGIPLFQSTVKLLLQPF